MLSPLESNFMMPIGTLLVLLLLVLLLVVVPVVALIWVSTSRRTKGRRD